MVNRPVLRYHGGKWRLAPWIISHFPEHKVYVEPFGGGASVLLRKRPSYAEVYNDLDGDIVNVFRVLRHPAQSERLEHLLRLTPFAREEFLSAYEPSDDPVERARRTIIRSFMGFGSNSIHRRTGFRNDSNRSGTTPAHDWVNYADAVRPFTSRLSGVVIEHRDAAEVIVQFDAPRALYYVDPPYVFSSRDNGQSDYAFEMDDAAHERLAEVLHGVRGMVVLSGYRSALYDQLYADWTCVEKVHHADGAEARVECLWLSPSVVVSPSLFEVEHG